MQSTRNSNGRGEQENKCVWVHKKLKKLNALLTLLKQKPIDLEIETDIRCTQLEIIFWKKYLKKHRMSHSNTD